ncbi:heterokaryon incompatibility protein-domain-containing protein [Lasiosphaeria hispida]|uniref:Heterokaryon incompatibility protein-domain-containing protein n=1 Tax=Lasiosphaeria hispida TaxID=260671 RepID=A0AAJ0H9K1_9PEZI|nr:heterokaryon incompatibility protein-domain-containing protein [Lasiosphaeria hispida]
MNEPSAAVISESRAKNASRPLCSSCQTAIAWTQGPDSRQLQEDSHVTLPFQPSFEALRESALECSLCEFVFRDVFGGKLRHNGWGAGIEDDPVSYKLHIESEKGFRRGLFKFDWEEALPYPSPNLGNPGSYWVVDSKDIERRAAWKEVDPTFDLRLQTVPEWISDCGTHHKRCADEAVSAWPRRLLDLTSVESLQMVKLIESCTLTGQSIRYATLSHCWGPRTSKPPLKTLKSNQAEHSNGIALDHLTLNFRDAVLVCRKLGLHYIWIDSLCIIQDDSADWEAEAAKMADIYRGSHLNIAAAAAADAHGGIIGVTSLQDPKDRLTSIRYASSPASDAPGTETLVLQAGLGPSEYRQLNHVRYPYLGRGWVLQELALSPRTVLFTAGQMFWQCRECFTSEDGTLWSDKFLSLGDGDQFVSAFDFSTPRAAHQTWNLWVKSYSQRQLTYASDVAPAIAGLIDFFSKELVDTAILGSWKETLRYDLSWSLSWRTLEHPPPPPTRRRRGEFPSWSWLSVLPRGGTSSDGDFELGTQGPYHDDNWSALRVEAWDETWAGARYASRLARSRLVVSTFVRDATLVVHSSGEWRSALQHVDVLGAPGWAGDCFLDYLFPAGSRVAVKILHVNLGVMKAPSSGGFLFSEHFLVVRPADDRPGCYYRVGSGRSKGLVRQEWDRDRGGYFFYDEAHRGSVELV